MDDFDPPKARGGFRIPLLGALLALFLVPPVIHGVGGAIVGYGAVGDFEDVAATYDASFDPILVHDGVVSAGPRIVHYADGSQTLLVDPDETVPMSSIHTMESIVVRRTEIVRIRPFSTQHTDIAELQDTFGLGDIVIDSAHLQAWIDANRTWLVLGIGVMFALGALWDWLTLPIMALVGAAVGRAVHGERSPFATLFGLGLLLGVGTVAMRWLTWSVGLTLGCADVFVWGALVVGLTAVLPFTFPRG